jgi:hypothetical protein
LIDNPPAYRPLGRQHRKMNLKGILIRFEEGRWMELIQDLGVSGVG